MDIEELKNKLDTNGLGKYFVKLKPILRNTIRFYQQSAEENQIAIGQTKIGGKPDLPPEITWVEETNIVETTEKKFFLFNRKKEESITKPLAFIAQINLSETASFDKENLLPKTGLLYFFYSAEQEAWGFDNKDSNKFKVIYWGGDLNQLKRTDFPKDLPEHTYYKPCAVNMVSEISLPSSGHEFYDQFADGEDDIFWDEVYNDGSLNKILGYSDNI